MFEETVTSRHLTGRPQVVDKSATPPRWPRDRPLEIGVSRSRPSAAAPRRDQRSKITRGRRTDLTRRGTARLGPGRRTWPTSGAPARLAEGRCGSASMQLTGLTAAPAAATRTTSTTYDSIRDAMRSAHGRTRFRRRPAARNSLAVAAGRAPAHNATLAVLATAHSVLRLLARIRDEGLPAHPRVSLITQAAT